MRLQNSHGAWLPWLVVALFSFVIIRALATGRIRGRSSVPLFTRNETPVGYWVSIAILGSLGAAMIWLALH